MANLLQKDELTVMHITDLFDLFLFKTFTLIQCCKPIICYFCAYVFFE